MTKEDLTQIQIKLDYQFKNVDLLDQAFTRKSYSEENGGSNNEVLEFFGDKALDLIVVKYLSDEYGYFSHDEEGYDRSEADEFWCEYDEGELTQMKARLVQKKTLAHRIDLLGFTKYLYMGKGDIEKHVERQDSVKEDLFEAIVGAVALDSGWELSVLERIVNFMLDFDSELEDSEDYENYIGMVQDWALKNGGELPLYHTDVYRQAYMFNGTPYIYGARMKSIPISAIGADPYPKRMCYMKFPWRDEVFLDAGVTDHDAKMGVAKAAYEYLQKNNLLQSIEKEILNPSEENAISQLETLARRGYFKIPEYHFEESLDGNGNYLWTCKCSAKGLDYSTSGKSSSKKAAKKQAAYKMLQRVLKERKGQ